VEKPRLGERAALLGALELSLEREGHNLVDRPDLLWQQLYNRLQWETGLAAGILGEESSRRTGADRPVWMRSRFPLPESGASRKTLTGHSGAVNGCAVSPDGSYIVSAGADGTLKIWDPATGAERDTLAGHSGAVNGCAVSPDGSYIVSAGADGTLKIWDPATGAERDTLAGHSGAVNGCAVSPDGSYIVSAGADGTLKIWDPATGAERDTLAAEGRSVSGCAISPDGRLIVGTCLFAKRTEQPTNVFLWQVSSAMERAALGAHPALTPDDWPHANECAVSPDAELLVTVGDDHTVKIWTLPTGVERATLAGHTAGVNGCVVSPDGSYIVSASADQTLRVWDRSAVARETAKDGHKGGVRGCAISPDGSFVVTAGEDLTVRLWDCDSGKEMAVLRGHTRPRDQFGWVHHCAVSPDASFVVSAGEDATVRIWDPASGEERVTLKGHRDSVGWCDVSWDGVFVLSRGWDGLRLWEAATGRALPGGVILRTPEGSLVVSRISRVSARVQDVSAVRRAATIPCDDDQVLARDPAESFYITQDDRAGLRIRDTDTGLERFAIAGTFARNSVRVTPDGSFIVVVSDRRLSVWDARDGSERALLPLAGHATCLALHRSRPLAAVGDEGGNAYLVESLGLEYGPIVVTAVDVGQGSEVRCPHCGQVIAVPSDWLGREVECPRDHCDGGLRVNPLALQPKSLQW